MIFDAHDDPESGPERLLGALEPGDAARLRASRDRARAGDVSANDLTRRPVDGSVQDGPGHFADRDDEIDAICRIVNAV